MEPYKPPLWLSNGHLLSIYPSLFRRVDTGAIVRERIATPDADFLDLDWMRVGSRALVIISHGLEGNSRRHYVQGMARAANSVGWDALGWNFRSCGGEMNRHLRFYHSGATDDLAVVIRHALACGSYKAVVLVGFSMGGNLTLVHLGQQGEGLPDCVKGAVVFSVPCDLQASAQALAKPRNKIYMRRFLRDLHTKMREKHRRFPGAIDLSGYRDIQSFKEFDDRYTAPLHGFRNAHDYWQQCSSRHYIHAIRVPTVIVNAEDDPFLADACYPHAEVKANSKVMLETPRRGGHVGFVSFDAGGHYWSEQRVMHFLNSLS